ncbi:YciI family protein [Rubellimicrobium roseum]|uniref:YCII-related domain-containing protein n=1 Tax=Rubellimicrobium roseum TaxID=687525 RepID=A0A5C4NRB2_9RHOB|nr:YciI family protein [Rubellimicrobium roseum]TNC74939.1 hypothetical protein FHG71_02090 [Rubellimicrobium roseum]
MPTFAYRILAPRPDFAATLQPPEMELMGRHFAHLQRLQAEGVVRYAGRAANGDYGLCVFEAPDEAAARAIAQADPAVAGGLVSVEVHPFVVVLDGPAR